MVNYFCKKSAIIDVDRVLNTPCLWYIVELQAFNLPRRSQKVIQKQYLLGVFCKKGVLENMAKFTIKHLCQYLFFNKVAAGRPCNFIKKETLVQVFSCEFCQIFKNAFFIGHLRWLWLPLCG